jgi:hypothetical protein
MFGSFHLGEQQNPVFGVFILRQYAVRAGLVHFIILIVTNA